MQKSIIIFLLVLFALAGSPVFAQTKSPQVPPETKTPERRAVEAMQSFYNNKTGLWDSAGWWNSANVLTTLVRYAKFSGNKELFPVIDNTFQNAQSDHFRGQAPLHPASPGPANPANFINDYNDDEGWWGLAWVEAYELTTKKEYLDTAVFLFEDMTQAWSGQHNGGIVWKKGEKYKASIANSLFMLLALRLHANKITAKINGHTPLEWAEKDWKWFWDAGLIHEETFQVFDGIRENGEIRRTQWTYNQGVVMAVLVEWYLLKQDEKFLELAQNIADATIRLKSRDGVLHEHNEPNMGNDGVQFKGVFMRHLYPLYKADPKERYKEFIESNANAIWRNRNPENNRFGGVWSDPVQTGRGRGLNRSNAGAHSSALDAIVTRLGIQGHLRE